MIDRRLESTPIELALPLPAGAWHGAQTIESADSLTSPEVTVDRTDVDVNGTLGFMLPANGLAVFRLTSVR